MKNLHSQFKKILFKTEGEFDKWLSEETFYKVYLEERSGDMSVLYVHKSGEILHTDFHQRLYCGCFVNVKELRMGKQLFICADGDNEYVPYGNLIIEEVVQ